MDFVRDHYFPLMAREMGEAQEWEHMRRNLNEKLPEVDQTLLKYASERAGHFSRYLMLSDNFLCRKRSAIPSFVS